MCIPGKVLFLYACSAQVYLKKKSEILKMVVKSLNIYVGRDFRKLQSPRQAVVGITAGCSCPLAVSHVLMLEASQPAQCVLAGASKRCVQHSPSAPGLPWRMLSRDTAAVIGDSVSLFLQIFFSLLGFPALKSCFEPKESKRSFWLCGEEEQRGI